KAGKEKREFTIFEADQTIRENVINAAKERLTKAIQVEEKEAREEAIDSVKEEIVASYEDDEEDISHVKMTLDDIVKAEVRRLITDEKVSPDDRQPDDIRPLYYLYVMIQRSLTSH